MEVAGRRSRCSVAMSPSPWRVGRSRPSGRSALRRSRVLLALCFLALPLHARLLVVLAAAGLGEDAGLLDLLVEAAEGALERLVLTHSNFCQSGIHLPGPGVRRGSRLVARRARRGPLASVLAGPPECGTGPLEGQTLPRASSDLAAETSSVMTSDHGRQIEPWPASSRKVPRAPGMVAASQRPCAMPTRRSS